MTISTFLSGLRSATSIVALAMPPFEQGKLLARCCCRPEGCCPVQDGLIVSKRMDIVMGLDAQQGKGNALYPYRLYQ